MNKALLLPLVFLSLAAGAQRHGLEMIKQTDTVIAVPESVLPDLKNGLLYISLIDGGGWDADGKGGVGIIGPGDKYNGTWITGLNAPKGLGRWGNRLFVADISEVVVIDVAKGRIEKKIAIDSAKGLNDITIDSKGAVYVSDSKTARIWKIVNDHPVLYLENMNGVNGLKAIGDDLYILSGKSFIKADRQKHITSIAELPQGGDGIEPVGNGDFIVTSWSGYIFYITAHGAIETMLDTHLEKMNTADIGYDQQNRILYVPTFNAKKIVTYKLVDQKTLPSVLLLDAGKLDQAKTAAKANEKEASRMVDSLKKRADILLGMKLLSVMDKKITPVSGNKHDYMSQAPYFWYDSTKPNGLPYMRKDGQRNPEINKISDRQSIGELESATRVLALTYYFTGQEKYATKASALLRHWFLEGASKMNPNLEYAQGIPGINNGRGIGIIETRALTGIADAASLLAGSSSWTATDAKNLKQWYTEYLHWMLTSKNGNDEHNAKNNHGTWYYVQVVDMALFTGDIATAKKLAEESKRRLDSQITAEGKMPLELERTNALGYSTFNLRAWFDLATLSAKAGVDLWQYRNPQGASIRTALDWLLPYAIGEKKWEYQQIGGYNRNEFYPLLLQAGEKYNEPTYARKAAMMKQGNGNVMDLLQ